MESSLTAETIDAKPALEVEPTSPPARRWMTFGRDSGDRLRAILAVLLPPGLFATMRPETYGQIPNPLDPVFYTGFSINFDDIHQTLPDRYYFMARWSAYMPQRLLCSVFGPETGRLMWRWILASCILGALFHLGKRRNWNVGQQLIVGVVVLTTPAFVRAFFTDYVEYLIASLGIVACCVVLSEADGRWSKRSHLGSPALLGLLIGLILVANPVGIVLAGVAVTTYAVLGLRNGRHHERGIATVVFRLVMIAMTAAAVVCAGWLFFRVVYDQPNLYASTIDMISRVGVDPVRSPRLEWMGRFTWLYATPILICTYFGIWFRPKRPGLGLDVTEWSAISMAIAQYGVQWADQLVRDGPGLEISYYFVYSLPSFALVAVLFVSRLARTASVVQCAIAAAIWAFAVWCGVGDTSHLPAGIKFLVIAVVVVVALSAIGRRQPTAAGIGVGAFLLATQIAAPPYDPTAYHLYNYSPRYDELFRKKPSRGAQTLSEASWLVNELDQIPDDQWATFVPIGGWLSDPNFVAGIYGAQPPNRLMYLNADLTPTPQTVYEIGNGSRPLVVVLGPPEQVDTAVAAMRNAQPEMYPIRSATHDGGFGYKYVVLAVPHSTRLPLSLDGADLRIQSGTVEGTTVRSPVGNTSIVTYGPYVALPAGNYVAELTYTAAAGSEATAGTVDTFFSGFGVSNQAELRGTNGQTATVKVPFSSPSDGARIEVRPTSNGTIDITIVSLRITHAN